MGELERGRREGREDAEHEHEHERRRLGELDALLRELTKQAQEHGSQIRSLQEQGRLVAERVTVAATTLVAETERRRSELELSAAAGDRSFSKRERVAALFVALTVGSGTLYIALHK